MTGNPSENIAKSIKELFSDIQIDFVSRSTTSTFQLDLCNEENVKQLGVISLDYDIFINSSLLKNFYQTIILQYVWTEWRANNKSGHIISFGSSADYWIRADNKLYGVEKRSLRDLNRNLSLHVQWYNSKIKTTYFAFGGVNTPKSQKQWPAFSKHTTEEIASYVKWLVDSPPNINIDEIHITPIQEKHKRELVNNTKVEFDSGHNKLFLEI